MFICFNCKQFTPNVYTCDNCKKDVCFSCILITDYEIGRYPHFSSYSQLCSKCQCAGCIQKGEPYNLCVGWDTCKECELQYCDECFKNTKCYKFKHEH